ncbi:bifunctional glutamate N-acetyltransferase/amino-acid acetyltransferase ArgJ, partial [candidate division NPL-UPA2 bacterium]|nr:bifunctional glutamate N-acetyltransferase/amino-acid acetyltransferase ArgJ [candidate division NPL-UPA2 bacterium]
MREIKGGITIPRGFKAAGIKCGLKKNKKDLAMFCSEVPARAIALFTTNRIWAAPLKITREHLRDGRAQAVIINSGNANACTGKKGLDNARLMTELTARNLKIKERDVLIASTGIIGRPLPMDKISQGIKGLAKRLEEEGGLSAAEAIMTTDTFPKEKAVKIRVKGKEVFIGGMAKGAGMISPHLATMLSFITTDALIAKRALRKTLKDSVAKSFNMITIDRDMSTNDMVVILANGLAKNEEIEEGERSLQIFREALDFVTLSLARMIVADGEGATKFVEIKVKNAQSSQEAKKAAHSIANSILVKTALFGEDANWGRIMVALGQAGIKLKEERVNIRLGRKTIVKDGQAAKFDEV